MSEKKTILVVDDDPDFVAIVQERLEREGFEVDVAYGGAEALQRVKSSPPDALVLDVMMPETDGYTVCAELKEDKEYADLPIILLTAVASHVPSTRYSHYDGMTAEADDYLPKPSSPEQILGSIKRVLKL
jgi:two-component system alkaline phosphatase synthesis response regulator PhoP